MSTKTIASSQQTIQEKQSTHRNQDDTFNNLSLSTYQHCIGVIRGEWFSYSDPKKLETICYGTAIALSKRVILTCAHTLYLEKKRRICNNISFILNQENGYMRQGQKIYRASDVNYIQLQQLTLSQTFMKKAIPEDLALVYLNEDLPLEDFPEVGLDISLNSKEVSVKDSLYISGYPSSQYFNKVQLTSIGFNRIDLQGTLEGIDANSSVIYHNLNTKTGHSGSAIFARNNQTEKPTIIGIHTHKGRLNNSGVILTEMLLKRIANYDISFALNHTQYDASVKLPLKIRTAVFEDLSKQKKDLVQRKSGNYRFYQQKESQDSDDECSEIDMQLFGVECHLQIQEKNQEFTVQNNSIKIDSQIQPYYSSIQEFEELQNQAITKYTASQQSTNQRNQLKTTNINLRSKQRTISGSDIEQNNLKKRNKLQINILQISQYLERINIFGQLLHSLNQQKCFEKIESISEDLLSNKNIGTQQQFYQAVCCDNYCQNYSLRIKERQLSL